MRQISPVDKPASVGQNACGRSICGRGVVMSEWPTFEELWRKAIGDTIIAVFANPQIGTGLYSIYEFDFESGLIIQLCLAHQGLATYDVPILPNEYLERRPLDVPCVGQAMVMEAAGTDTAGWVTL